MFDGNMQLFFCNNIIKNIAKTIIILLLFCAFYPLLLSCVASTTPDYEEKIFDNYLLERFAAGSHRIALIKGDEEKVIFDGLIYKYAYDSNKKYIVAHCMQLANEDDEEEKVIYVRKYASMELEIVSDDLLLYSCVDDTYKKFGSIIELKKFCDERKVSLSNWYYPNIGESFISQVTELTENYKLCTRPYGYSAIELNSVEVIRGYITDYKVTEDTIEFRLRQTDYDYDEEYIGTVNKELAPLSKEPIGKYRRGFLQYEDIYYDKTIVIHVKTGQIIEK